MPKQMVRFKHRAKSGAAMSTHRTDPALSVEFLPCVGFFGRAQEALDFYANLFDGDYEILRRGDSGAGIMFARFTAPGILFAVTDGGTRRHGPDVGNVALTLNVKDQERARQIFSALSEGGRAVVPLGDVPWGGQFGILFDRFDNEWLITSSE